MDPTRRALLGLGRYSAALVIPGWPEVSQRFQRLRRYQTMMAELRRYQRNPHAREAVRTRPGSPQSRPRPESRSTPLIQRPVTDAGAEGSAAEWRKFRT